MNALGTCYGSRSAALNTVPGPAFHRGVRDEMALVLLQSETRRLSIGKYFIQGGKVEV